MKKKAKTVLAAACLFFFFLAPSAFAESLVEKISTLGFPLEASISLAKLVEKREFTGIIDVNNLFKVSAAILNGKIVEDVVVNWGRNDYRFKAEKYAAENFVVYRLISLRQEMYFRIGDLPKPVQKVGAMPVPSVSLTEEKKAEVPKALSVSNPEVQGDGVEEVAKTPSIPVSETKGNGVEEVYEAMALPLDLKNLQEQPMTAIVVPIYQSPWIGDGLGMYVVAEKDGKEEKKFLTRKVWRAYIGVEMFPAVITKFGTNLFVITQGKNKEDLVGKNIVIISGSGKFALTISGNMAEFNLKEFEESEEYQKTFFEKNPSQVQEKMLIDISPNTENGKLFIRDLRKIFPHSYYVDGKLISTSTGTDSETLKALVGLNNNSSYPMKILNNGGLPVISTSSILFFPLELARMLIVWTMAAFDDSLNGNFLEAKVSGYQAAEALSSYLAECQEEMNYLTTLLVRR